MDKDHGSDSRLTYKLPSQVRVSEQMLRTTAVQVSELGEAQAPLPLGGSNPLY